MEDSREEYVFLGDKLGMLFNIHDNKVTVVGLDSNIYRQAPTTANTTATSGKNVVNELKNEEDDVNLYKDAISLVPSVSRQNSVGAPSVDENAQQDSIFSIPVEGPSNDEKNNNPMNRDDDVMSAAEVISALANLDVEDRQSAAIVVEAPVGEDEQIIMNPIEGSSKVMPALRVGEDHISIEENKISVLHASQSVGTKVSVCTILQ